MDRPGFLRRLPRFVYWLTGAAIALGGAFVARGLADQVAGEAKIPFWIAGSLIIFVGLWVLSQGTRSRVANESGDEPADADKAE
jgi:putative Mn2+ efflux pump MntP